MKKISKKRFKKLYPKTVQAFHQADVPNARWWVASGHVKTKLKMLFIECERWVDARTVARTLIGPEASVVGVADGLVKKTPRTRVQVRWTGSAATRSLDLRLQRREIKRGMKGTWVDV